MSKIYIERIKNPFLAFLYSPKRYISLIKYITEKYSNQDINAVGNIRVRFFSYDSVRFNISKYTIVNEETSIMYIRIPYSGSPVYFRAVKGYGFSCGFKIIILEPRYTKRNITYELDVVFLGGLSPSPDYYRCRKIRP